ncbi:MAG: metallophosphoesterase [Candidatus Helarchaeota archaeon]
MVKIGIISDTHDNLDIAKNAVKYFNSNNIDYCLHAGDIIAPFVAKLVFNDLKCKERMTLVQGNNDGEIQGNRLNFTKIGCTFAGTTYIGTIDNKKVIMQHDIHPTILESLAASQKFDIIIYGHTHKPEIKKVKNTIIINPGECCGLLSGDSTIAILDTEKMEAEIIKL